jgi:hypothetical protein
VASARRFDRSVFDRTMLALVTARPVEPPVGVAPAYRALATPAVAEEPGGR